MLTQKQKNQINLSVLCVEQSRYYPEENILLYFSLEGLNLCMYSKSIEVYTEVFYNAKVC